MVHVGTLIEDEKLNWKVRNLRTMSFQPRSPPSQGIVVACLCCLVLDTMCYEHVVDTVRTTTGVNIAEQTHVLQV